MFCAANITKRQRGDVLFRKLDPVVRLRKLPLRVALQTEQLGAAAEGRLLIYLDPGMIYAGESKYRFQLQLLSRCLQIGWPDLEARSQEPRPEDDARCGDRAGSKFLPGAVLCGPGYAVTETIKYPHLKHVLSAPPF